MENQRLQECWPGRRRWKGKAFVPCTCTRVCGRSQRGNGVQGAAPLCWDGLRGEGIPLAPGLRCREGGGGSLGAPQLLGMNCGLPAGPPCATSPWVALGAPAVPPWGGWWDPGQGLWPPELCQGHSCPGQAHPGATHGRVGHRDFAPAWGQSPSCPGTACLSSCCSCGAQRGVTACLWGGKGAAGVPWPCWQLWGGCCGSRRCPGGQGRAVLGSSLLLGPGGHRGRDVAPAPRLAPRTHVRPFPFPVRVTGRGVAGGARREEEGGHEPFLPGSLSRDHLGLPGATGCSDTAAVLVPSCVAAAAGLARSAGGPEVAEGRSNAPVPIVVSRSPRHFCHL